MPTRIRGYEAPAWRDGLVDVLLGELVRTSAAVAATSARSGKVELLAACLRAASPDEVAVVVSYLSGELPQRRTGVGWAALRNLPPPAAAPSLSVLEVDAALATIAALAGAGSALERGRSVGALFARASAAEQQYLTRLLGGELRQGALAGVMVEAVAKAAGVGLADVRQALMLRGALPPVAEAALSAGAAGLADFRLELGRPIAPMLAQSAGSVAEALGRTGPAAVDRKLDGIRIQVHRAGQQVTVFTRTLEEITSRVPEVVAAARQLPVAEVVLDGEVIALAPDGRPRPFQQTASRVARRGDVPTARHSALLSAYFFDVLYLDGTELLGMPGADRARHADRVLPATLRVPRIGPADAVAAAAFLADSLAAGHEGVVVKSLAAPYQAGRRGAGWVKVKPRHTLDLVVLAAEWGYGRRSGWLSNLHLGARDEVGGGFVMLGKTFKGLTDALLRWQTERLLELAVVRDEYVVQVRPELVVEVAFDGVQTSRRYPGGMALRFARVLRYREDKVAAQADTVTTVRAIRDR